MRWNLKAWEELTRDELYAIISARLAVFVVEQQCPYLDTDSYDQRALHLWAHDDETPVLAYLRVFGPGVKYEEASLGRVLTTAAARGRGLGRAVVRQGIEVVAQRFGKLPIRIGAQKYLEKFYGELGFVVAGPEYLEDGIPHVEMCRG